MAAMAAVAEMGWSLRCRNAGTVLLDAFQLEN
jgi:hypothetical protein